MVSLVEFKPRAAGKSIPLVWPNTRGITFKVQLPLGAGEVNRSPRSLSQQGPLGVGFRLLSTLSLNRGSTHRGKTLINSYEGEMRYRLHAPKLNTNPFTQQLAEWVPPACAACIKRNVAKGVVKCSAYYR